MENNSKLINQMNHDNNNIYIFYSLFYHSNHHIFGLSQRQKFKASLTTITPLHYLLSLSNLPEYFKNTDYMIEVFRTKQYKIYPNIELDDFCIETSILSKYELIDVDISLNIPSVTYTYSPLFYQYISHYKISIDLINRAFEHLKLI